MIPLDVKLEDGVLRWATTELDGAGDVSTLLLRRLDRPGSALVETDREVEADDDVTVTRTDQGALLTWPGGTASDRVTVRLR